MADEQTKYISQDDAEQFICEVCERPGCPMLWGGDCDRIDRLNKISAADVRPVIRAHWIDMKPTNEETGLPISIKGPDFRCSNCGATEFPRNFCPNCGADMRR